MNTSVSRYGNQAISSRQIKIIHTLKGVLGMDDGAYRAMLQDFAGVDSSKSLSWREADDLISDMQRKAGNYPSEKSALKTRYNDLAYRHDMATPPQLRKIEATWSDVSRAETPDEKKKALRAFLERIAKVSDLRFLDRDGASKTITALEAMKKKLEIGGKL